MTKHYVAHLDGALVGKRSSKSRSYTHAVVIRHDREDARRYAYEYKATKTDRSNFDYYTKAVATGPSFYSRLMGREYVESQLAHARELIEGGYDAYIGRLRAREIERFEARSFEPFVVTWCGRPDLAEKAASPYRKRHDLDLVVIVPAEEVFKGRRRSNADDYCDDGQGREPQWTDLDGGPDLAGDGACFD